MVFVFYLVVKWFEIAFFLLVWCCSKQKQLFSYSPPITIGAIFGRNFLNAACIVTEIFDYFKIYIKKNTKHFQVASASNQWCQEVNKNLSLENKWKLNFKYLDCKYIRIGSTFENNTI